MFQVMLKFCLNLCLDCEFLEGKDNIYIYFHTSRINILIGTWHTRESL
jgi:hypothetical protein